MMLLVLLECRPMALHQKISLSHLVVCSTGLGTVGRIIGGKREQDGNNLPDGDGR